MKSVCGPVLCALAVCYTWGPEEGFSYIYEQRLLPLIGLGTAQKWLCGVRDVVFAEENKEPQLH